MFSISIINSLCNLSVHIYSMYLSISICAWIHAADSPRPFGPATTRPGSHKRGQGGHEGPHSHTEDRTRRTRRLQPSDQKTCRLEDLRTGPETRGHAAGCLPTWRSAEGDTREGLEPRSKVLKVKALSQIFVMLF